MVQKLRQSGAQNHRRPMGIMPGGLTDDIPIQAEQGLGYYGDQVGMLRSRPDIEGLQGYK